MGFGSVVFVCSVDLAKGSDWQWMPDGVEDFLRLPLRVQVPNNHILTQNQYYNYYYPKPKYLIIGYMDPLGSIGIIMGYLYRTPAGRLPKRQSRV